MIHHDMIGWYIDDEMWWNRTNIPYLPPFLRSFLGVKYDENRHCSSFEVEKTMILSLFWCFSYFFPYFHGFRGLKNRWYTVIKSAPMKLIQPITVLILKITGKWDENYIKIAFFDDFQKITFLGGWHIVPYPNLWGFDDFWKMYIRHLLRIKNIFWSHYL